MPREFSRTQRIADQMQRELSGLIRTEVKDPRLGMVTISHVKVSKDLGFADVYVTVLGGGQADADASVQILNRAAGFLRGRISQEMRLRVMPSLRFHYDASIERGNYLSSLIDKAVAEDNQRHQGQAPADSADGDAGKE